MDLKKVLRITFSILLIPSGAVLILLADAAGRGHLLVLNLGVALVVAGIVSTFQEAVLNRLDNVLNADVIVQGVVKKLAESPFRSVGIQLVDKTRIHSDVYFHWAVHQAPESLFFAGRSVLHRIDDDFKERKIGAAHEILAKRLDQGSSIRLLFLDPRSKLIPKLAADEGQTEKQLMEDLCVSLGVCRRLHNLLAKSPRHAGSIDVCIYDDIPYFAYHQVGDEAIIGFYFAPNIGHSSGAYRIVDDQTKHFFQRHFDFLFNKSMGTWLLKKGPQVSTVTWHTEVFDQSVNACVATLGEARVASLLDGKR